MFNYKSEDANKEINLLTIRSEGYGRDLELRAEYLTMEEFANAVYDFALGCGFSKKAVDNYICAYGTAFVE